MLVLGIDPGTATTGYGLVRERCGKLECIGMGCVLTKAGTPLPERLESIFDQLSAIIADEKPDCAAVEKLFFNTNATSALAVGHARGVALLACQRAGLPVAEYTPLQVKLAVAGFGRADKKQIQSMVKLLMSLPEEPKPDDAADALAIAICHINTAPYFARACLDGDLRS
ncbi:MAG: crossover junction endodeoxyribonuclease RuvC [Clostridia bacterium]|nr:crossover junction endodeoxyribonuclease RuvC [Clostridia bacterium]